MPLFHNRAVPNSVPSILLTDGTQQLYIETRDKTPVREDGTPLWILQAPPATRRDATFDISHKAQDHNQRLNRKMEGKWSEVTFAKMASLVPGKDATKTHLKKLKKAFDVDWSSRTEKDMYPILVSRVQL